MVEPHAVRAALGKNRGGHPVNRARSLGAANSTCRKMEVSGFHDVCEGGRGGSRRVLYCTRNMRRIVDQAGLMA